MCMHASMITYRKFVSTISYHLCEFCQSYNFVAVGDNGELITF